MRALLSVADHAGIADLARDLLDQGIEVYATDGTRTQLSEAGVPVQAVSELTAGPDLIGGQVKTYHPEVYAAILARRHVPDDMGDLDEHFHHVGELVGHCLEHFGGVSIGLRRVIRLEELCAEPEGTTSENVHGVVGQVVAEST